MSNETAQLEPANLDFPPLPPHKAQWAPVYIEPVMAGGERIAVGVIAQDEQGETRSLLALTQRSVQCAFGMSGVALLQSAQAILDGLTEHLNAGHALDEWAAPLSGVELGKWKATRYSDMQHMLQTRLALVSSFAAGRDFNTTYDEQDDVIDPVDTVRIQVRDRVLAQREDWASRFNQRIAIQPDGRMKRFFYVSDKITINLASLNPLALSNSENMAHARFVALMMLRDFNPMLNEENYELILHYPGNGAAGYDVRQMSNVRQSVDDLVNLGDKERLRVYAAATIDAASQRILERAAA